MKRIICIIIILFLIGSYFFTLLIPKNYKTNYTINHFNIVEEYLKKEKIINFQIQDKENKFELSLNIKYPKKRQIINDIKTYNENSVFCIYPLIDNIKTFPLCEYNGEKVHFSLINNETFKEFLNTNYKIKNNEINDEYEKIDIYNYDNSVFLIWNYDTLLFLSEKENKKIKLFDFEVLDTSLITRFQDYLVIPNYNEKHNFSSLYVIDTNKFEKKLWEIDYEISYNSYILGVNNNIYLVDRKNKLQYEINPHRRKISIVNIKDKDPIIYLDDWKNISINKLINKDYEFQINNAFNYEYKNNNLYLLNVNKYKMLLIPDKEINIVQIDKNKIYYLINDKLYAFDLFFGNKELMNYFEWNFNNINKIFVYDK